ncbi:MAG TPA: transposase [Leptolyngbyaceae cyanobacterium]
MRHLKALAWMVSALIYSGQVSLSAWEPYVLSRARLAQSFERRWHRFCSNRLICVKRLYLPLVLLALKGWQAHRLYLALDTTVLWERYCMIHLSVVCCGRAVPLLWHVLEHSSATVAFKHYRPLLRQARWLLRYHPDVMLLADRGFANHSLMAWLGTSGWHYCLRLPCDVLLHGPRRYPIEVSRLLPPVGEACFYRNVGLWQEARHRAHLVLAHVKAAKEPWAVITDESPSLKTLWQYALRFQVEELFLDSKSGAFGIEGSRIRSAQDMQRLYLVVAIALLYGTTQGMAVHLQGLRRQVDPHWQRGISYLKIGLRWLRGVGSKGRQLLAPVPLLPKDPQPCFASQKARWKHYDQIWFSRIRSLDCRT